jgi:hypothetical protein
MEVNVHGIRFVVTACGYEHFGQLDLLDDEMNLSRCIGSVAASVLR